MGSGKVSAGHFCVEIDFWRLKSLPHFNCKMRETFVNLQEAVLGVSWGLEVCLGAPSKAIFVGRKLVLGVKKVSLSLILN